MALENEGFDDFSRAPAAVFDGSMIEGAVSRGLEFELGAVGLEFGKFLFRTQVGGLEGFHGDLVHSDGPRDVELGFFQADRCVSLVVGKVFASRGSMTAMVRLWSRISMRRAN